MSENECLEVRQEVRQQEVAHEEEKLLGIFGRLLPLVDTVADSIRFALLLGIGLISWIFVWLFFLKDFSLMISGAVAIIASLPLLMLLRFWWSLEQLKKLPEIIQEMIGDAKSEVLETVRSIRTRQSKKLQLFSSVKKMWAIGAMVRDARDLIGSYMSIGVLINPLSLILGILSLMFVISLIPVGAVLAIFAF